MRVEQRKIFLCYRRDGSAGDTGRAFTNRLALDVLSRMRSSAQC
jgi:hypothetical protein